MNSRIFYYIALTRPINCLITFLTVLIGGYIISNSYVDFNILSFAALSASLIAAAGNVINDIYDIELDKIAHPKRPLPSGKISIREATFFYVALNFFSLAILSFTEFELFIIGIFTIVILYLYSSWLKRVFVLSNLIVAALTGLTFIFAGVAVNNVEYSLIPALFAFLINLIREIVKDIEDLSGDKNYHINSIPIILGVDRAKIVIVSLMIAFIITTIFPFIMSIYKIEFFIIVMTLVNPLLVYSLKLINQNTSSKNLKTISKILKTNMILGLIAIYFGK